MEKYIIFCGYVGLKGSLKIIESRYDELVGYFNKIYLDSVACHIKDRGYYGRYLSPINNDRPEIKPVDINSIFAGFRGNIEDVSEGGILDTLYNFAMSHRCGFEIEMKKIPAVQICIGFVSTSGLIYTDF